SRTGGDAELRARAASIAARIAERVGGAVQPEDRSPIDLSPRLAHARQLAVQGALDEAAAALDATFVDAVRELGRIADGPAFLTGHIRRSSIALARGEVTVARQLLARLHRYDPAFTLVPIESTPQLRASFQDVVAQLGPDPPVEPADLGDEC